MTPIQSINIPEACHESWQQMTSVEQGRHCQQCCKTVIDFTVMSNQEIINYLAASHDVCGRFDQEQLSSLNNRLDIENLQPSSWRRWVMVIGLLSGTTFFKAQAQTKTVKVEQTDTTRCKPIPYDDVKIGKVVQSVNAEQTVFQDKIQRPRIDSTLVVTAGMVRVLRPPFFKRLYYNLVRKPIRKIFN